LPRWWTRTWCGSAASARTACGCGSGAGAGSFRSEERLKKLLAEARQHVAQLRAQVDSPRVSGALSAAVCTAQTGGNRATAADGRGRGAVAGAEAQAGSGGKARGKASTARRFRARQPRVSTTDAQARVMKMPNGGFNPAVNVQWPPIPGAARSSQFQVTSEGTDSAGLSEADAQQVEQRSGGQVEQHLLDAVSAHRRHRTGPDRWRGTVSCRRKQLKVPRIAVGNWNPSR